MLSRSHQFPSSDEFHSNFNPNTFITTVYFEPIGSLLDSSSPYKSFLQNNSRHILIELPRSPGLSLYRNQKTKWFKQPRDLPEALAVNMESFLRLGLQMLSVQAFHLPYQWLWLFGPWEAQGTAPHSNSLPMYL